MANTKSAAKRARQTLRSTQRNRSIITRLRTMQRKVGAAAEATNVRELISAIDKAVKRGTIHRNAANRRKVRLNRLLVAKK
ncbi:MAG: small subunit ribosomal protein [Verrucomicrobiota bacterium]|jgi:small subunit ribosomal protein S20